MIIDDLENKLDEGLSCEKTSIQEKKNEWFLEIPNTIIIAQFIAIKREYIFCQSIYPNSISAKKGGNV